MPDTAYINVSDATGYANLPVTAGVEMYWDATEGWIYATADKTRTPLPATFATLRFPGPVQFDDSVTMGDISADDLSLTGNLIFLTSNKGILFADSAYIVEAAGSVGGIDFGVAAGKTYKWFDDVTEILDLAAAALKPSPTATLDLGLSGNRWKGIFGATLDLSGNATILGDMGLGTASPDGKLHVFIAESSTPVHSFGDDAILEGAGNVGFSIINTDAGTSRFIMGSPSDPLAAFLAWSYGTRLFTIGTSVSSGDIKISSNDLLTLAPGGGTTDVTGDLDATGDMICQGGLLTVGVSDSVQGECRCLGGATNAGGFTSWYNAGGQDTLTNHWEAGSGEGNGNWVLVAQGGSGGMETIIAVDDNSRVIEFFKPGAWRKTSETIASGAITVSSSFIELTSESGSSDNLSTINGGVDGMMIVLKVASGHTITVDETINIDTGSGTKVMNAEEDKFLLIFDVSLLKWCKVSFGNNG